MDDIYDMDSAVLNRVTNFSKIVKNSADIIFQSFGALCIDACTLFEVEEAFSSILSAEQLTNFHVLPPNHKNNSDIDHIQFLYDILQKTQKLKIITNRGRSLPQEEKISLRCFRNVQILELSGISLEQVKGLQQLRPLLRELTIKNICSSLKDVLEKCAADKATEYAWENLQKVSFSHNSLKTIDNSVQLLTVLKVLDLSYCDIYDASSLCLLPCVSSLNLSYNRLTTIPKLSENASQTVQVLDLSYNMIMDLKGLDELLNLHQLNMEENFLSFEVTLAHVTPLKNLQSLNLLKNPITFNVNSRMKIIKYLNFNTRNFEKLLINNVQVNKNERQWIREMREVITDDGASSSFHLLKYLREKIGKILQSSPVSSQVGNSQSLEPGAKDQNGHLLSESPCNGAGIRRKKRRTSSRHIVLDEAGQEVITRKSPRRPKTYLAAPKIQEESNTMDGRRRQNGVEMSDPDMNIGPSHADLLLEEILNDHYRPPGLPEDPDFEICEKFEHFEPFVVSSSPIPTNDEELEPGIENQSVFAFWEDLPGVEMTESQSLECVVSISDHFYKEKNALTNGTVVKVSVSSLLHIKILSMEPRVKIQITIENEDPQVATRVLNLASYSDYQKLKSYYDEGRDNYWKAPFQQNCLACGQIFKGLRSDASRKTRKECRHCGNPMKNESFHHKNNVDEEIYMEKADSTESESSGTVVSDRRESDVEILSNPSMSSIEILSDNPKDHITSETIYEEMEDDELKKEFEAPKFLTEISSMEESGSSGSMTGSVCTAVNRMITKGALDEQNRVILDSGGVTITESRLDLKIWMVKLQSSYTGYQSSFLEDLKPPGESKNTLKSQPSISYDFSDFSKVDHRLDLYADVFLFSENNEKMQGLLKAIVLVEGQSPCHGFLVVSNRKIYLLEISPSQDGAPQEWIKDLLKASIKETIGLYSVGGGQGIIVQTMEKSVLLLFSEVKITESAKSFLQRSLSIDSVQDDLKLKQENSISKKMQVKSIGDILCFQTITMLKDDGDCESRFLVLTETSIGLFTADLNWFLPTHDVQSDIQLICMHRVEDLNRLEVKTKTVIELIFENDRLIFHVTSMSLNVFLVHTLRKLWMDIYQVELDIVCNRNSIGVIEKMLESY